MSREIEAAAARGSRLIVEDVKRRSQQESERPRADRHLRPAIAHRFGAIQRQHQPGCRHHRSPAARRLESESLVSPFTPVTVTTPGAESGRQRSEDEHQERTDHRRPRTETARATSRSITLRLIVSRLSCCFFPLPSPSATLARPRLK